MIRIMIVIIHIDTSLHLFNIIKYVYVIYVMQFTILGSFLPVDAAKKECCKVKVHIYKHLGPEIVQPALGIYEQIQFVFEMLFLQVEQQFKFPEQFSASPPKSPTELFGTTCTSPSFAQVITCSIVFFYVSLQTFHHFLKYTTKFSLYLLRGIARNI